MTIRWGIGRDRALIKIVRARSPPQAHILVSFWIHRTHGVLRARYAAQGEAVSDSRIFLRNIRSIVIFNVSIFNRIVFSFLFWSLFALKQIVPDLDESRRHIVIHCLSLEYRQTRCNWTGDWSTLCHRYRSTISTINIRTQVGKNPFHSTAMPCRLASVCNRESCKLSSPLAFIDAFRSYRMEWNLPCGSVVEKRENANVMVVSVAFKPRCISSGKWHGL